MLLHAYPRGILLLYILYTGTSPQGLSPQKSHLGKSKRVLAYLQGQPRNESYAPRRPFNEFICFSPFHFTIRWRPWFNLTHAKKAREPRRGSCVEVPVYSHLFNYVYRLWCVYFLRGNFFYMIPLLCCGPGSIFKHLKWFLLYSWVNDRLFVASVRKKARY